MENGCWLIYIAENMNRVHSWTDVMDSVGIIEFCDGFVAKSNILIETT